MTDWDEARRRMLWRIDVLTAVMRLAAEAGDPEAVKRLQRWRELRRELVGDGRGHDHAS